MAFFAYFIGYFVGACLFISLASWLISKFLFRAWEAEDRAQATVGLAWMIVAFAGGLGGQGSFSWLGFFMTVPSGLVMWQLAVRKIRVEQARLETENIFR